VAARPCVGPPMGFAALGDAVAEGRPGQEDLAQCRRPDCSDLIIGVAAGGSPKKKTPVSSTKPIVAAASTPSSVASTQSSSASASPAAAGELNFVDQKDDVADDSTGPGNPRHPRLSRRIQAGHAGYSTSELGPAARSASRPHRPAPTRSGHGALPGAHAAHF
jgi:hypothetical protein